MTRVINKTSNSQWHLLALNSSFSLIKSISVVSMQRSWRPSVIVVLRPCVSIVSFQIPINPMRSLLSPKQPIFNVPNFMNTLNTTIHLYLMQVHTNRPFSDTSPAWSHKPNATWVTSKSFLCMSDVSSMNAKEISQHNWGNKKLRKSKIAMGW